jgi:hypothetical protein
MNSIFDELGLVGKLKISTITSHIETPIRNKIGRS